MFDARAIEEVAARLRPLVRAVEPAEVIPDQALAVLSAFAAIGRMADAAVTRLAAKASDSQGWRDQHRDAAAWLAHTIGCDPFDARKLLTASEHLDRELDETWDALASGELTALLAAPILASRETNKAHRLEQERKQREAELAAMLEHEDKSGLPEDLFDDESDDAVEVPCGPTPAEVTAALLAKARNGSTIRDLNDEARRHAAAAEDAKQRAKRLHRGRNLRPRTYDDGSVGGTFAFPPTIGAAAIEKVKQRAEQLAHLARKTGREGSWQNHMADALCELLGVEPSVDPDAVVVPEPAPPARPTRGTRRPGSPRPPSPRPDNQPTTEPVPAEDEPVDLDPKAILRLDLEATRRGSLVPGDTSDLYGHGPVPLADSRAMLQRANAYLVIHDGNGKTRNVTRLGRRRPPDLPAALRSPGPAPSLDMTAILRIDATTIAPARFAPISDVPGVGLVSDHRLAQLIGHTWARAAEAGVDAQNVLYDTRLFPDVLWIAAFDQHPRCATCHKTGHLQADHKKPWILGGPTRLANLGLLCDYDHQTKTLQEAAQTIPAGIRAARQRATVP